MKESIHCGPEERGMGYECSMLSGFGRVIKESVISLREWLLLAYILIKIMEVKETDGFKSKSLKELYPDVELRKKFAAQKL